MSEDCLLIGDIGGTNARFALADSSAPGFSNQKTVACADYETVDLAIANYLEEIGSHSPSAICLAAAGPIVDDAIRVTNNHWTIDAGKLRADFVDASVTLLNDFEAIAWSIPFLTINDSVPLGLPEMTEIAMSDTPQFSLGIVGPGTGLGYAGLYKRNGVLVPITGEGGHQGFAPESQLQLEVLTALRDKFDRVSYECLVSGPGVENIYWALTKIHGENQNSPSAARIFALAESGEDTVAQDSVQLFFELLGQVAGNVAISMSTFDGVYIAGGIAKRYPQLLSKSRFRAGFENKGRHRALMERIPTRLITYDDPGLLGASFCAQEALRSAHGTCSTKP